MATVRPAITVYNLKGQEAGQIAAPAVFSAPIRADIVSVVHSNLAKNRRQAYAVKYGAGMQHSAESWGVGRSLSRIPRVAGGGTSRSGQGAFGNMCRKGRMFAPTKTWRKWHRKTQLNQKRFATVSALAASAVPSLVIARGHSIGLVTEVPLVIEGTEEITKTKDLLSALRRVGAASDVARAANSRKVRSGRSHQRNRVHSGRVGPLIVYKKNTGLVRAARNLPGVDTVAVSNLNLLQLAPGGHLGRFVIFTKDAAESLNDIFGTQTEESKVKKGYKLPRAKMTNADLDRIINSTEIQAVVRNKRNIKNLSTKVKLNPLKNFKAKVAINPYALVQRRIEVSKQARAQKAKAAKAAKPAFEVKPLGESTLKKIAAAQQYQAAFQKNKKAKAAFAATKQ